VVVLAQVCVPHLFDQDILIDCGTGIGDLSMDEMTQIQHVFLTHSHIDHTVSLPLLIDTLFGEVDHPLTVHGTQETIDAVRTHIFNWVMWPDFSEIPSKENPSLIFKIIEHDQEVVMGDRSFLPIPVNHVVPTVGYAVKSAEGGVFVFSGDTAENDTLWPVMNAFDKIDVFVVETAFDDGLEELATMAGHYSPSTLAKDLQKLDHDCNIWMTHLKPGHEEKIFQQLTDLMPERSLHRLLGNEHFNI